MIVTKEAWYREASEQEYQRLLKEWAKDPYDLGLPRDRTSEPDMEIVERILRLHQRLGKPPEDIRWLLQHYGWEHLKDIPIDLLPPVTYRLTYRIERYIDSSSYGTADRGYVGPNGVFAEASEAGPYTKTVQEFFTMLDSEDWDQSVWGEGGHSLVDGPGIELEDHVEGDERALQALSKDLYNQRNQINYYWEDNEDHDEQYLEEMAGWKVTIQIVDADADSGSYLKEVIEWGYAYR